MYIIQIEGVLEQILEWCHNLQCKDQIHNHLTYGHPIWAMGILVGMLYVLQYFRGDSCIDKNECQISFCVNINCPRQILNHSCFHFLGEKWKSVLKIVFYKKSSFQNFISFSKIPKITFLCQTSHYYVENKKKSKLLSFNCFYTEYKNSYHI